MMHYALTLVTAPTSEPVSREEAKLWCKVEADSKDDDDVMDAVVAGARKHIESRIEKCLFTQTWRLTLDCFPSVIYVPRPPLASVSSITYLDTSGTSQTLATTEYRVDTESSPGRITTAYGKTWPTTYGVIGAVTVNFIAGKTVPSIDPDTKLALRILVNYFYMNRGDVDLGPSQDIRRAVDSLLGLQEVGSYA